MFTRTIPIRNVKPGHTIVVSNGDGQHCRTVIATDPNGNGIAYTGSQGMRYLDGDTVTIVDDEARVQAYAELGRLTVDALTTNPLDDVTNTLTTYAARLGLL